MDRNMAFDGQILFDICYKGQIRFGRSLTDCFISLASVNPCPRIVTRNRFFQAFRLGCQNHTIATFPVIVTGPFIRIVVVLCQNRREFADIVFDIIEVMGEPSIEQVIEILLISCDTIASRNSCWIDMVSLMEIEFYILAGFLQGIVHKLKLFGFNIVII